MKRWLMAGALLLCGGIGCGSDETSDGDRPSSASGAGASGGSGAGASGSGAAGSGAAGSGASGSGAAGAQGGAGGGDVGGSGGGGGGTLWEPAPGTSWQWQLQGDIDTSFDVAVYDIDLFVNEQSVIDGLHADGRKVICYFSAGSWESYRPDSDQYPESIKGDPLDSPFDDELWVDIRSDELRTLLEARLDLAVQKGCDAVEPDNVDGYSNDNGLGLTAADQLDFNAWMAGAAHARGLSVGLKNDLNQLGDLVADFDWALNEECFSYDECDGYQPTFIAAGKAVFHAEYVNANQLDAVCAVTQPLTLSTLIKHIELDAYQVPCP